MILSILSIIFSPVKLAFQWLSQHPKVLVALVILGLFAYAFRETYVRGWNDAIYAQQQADIPVVTKLTAERDELQRRINAMNALAEQQRVNTEADAKAGAKAVRAKTQARKDALGAFINSLPDTPVAPASAASGVAPQWHMPVDIVDHINEIHRILE